MLNRALAQTYWDKETIAPDNWRDITLRRLGEIDWRAAVKDVRPFLMDSREIDLLTLDTFTRLLSS
jgi:hypothetical protein